MATPGFRTTRIAALLIAATMVGCGEDQVTPAPTAPPAANPPPRGTLLQSPPAISKSISAASLLVQLNLAANLQLLGVSGPPVCDITVYRLEYQTVAAVGESSTASAAMMVPGGSGVDCSGPRPMLLYAHGTQTDRAFNIADLDNAENAEGLLMATMFAAHGYIVVAPNFVGYDGSSVTYHAYLNADQQSKDMIDALTAARSALPTIAASLTSDDGRLYVTGYSQGGHVAMATHRAMQSLGMAVTAAAPMSGPYALAAFVDAVFFGRVNLGAPVHITFLIASYQKSYSNLYASSAEVFQPQYASGIDTLLPTDLPRGELYAQGKLPRTALFDTAPPAPEFASVTPATTPVEFAPLFARGFGSDFLIRNDYRLGFLRDGLANPDGGWPTITSGDIAASPTHPLRRAVQQNDLRNWVPSSPVLLCGGDGDPTVFWFNTELLQRYWSTHGTASTPYSVLDVDAVATVGDPYASYKAQFAAAKDLLAASAVLNGASDGGAQAVAEAYHSTLVPPFCLAAVRSFFSTH